MKKEIQFLIYCIEVYKNAKKLSGKEVAVLFQSYGIMEYITQCYEFLHTTGENYIIEDIDGYIKSRQESA